MAFQRIATIYFFSNNFNKETQFFYEQMHTIDQYIFFSIKKHHFPPFFHHFYHFFWTFLLYFTIFHHGVIPPSHHPVVGRFFCSRTSSVLSVSLENGSGRSPPAGFRVPGSGSKSWNHHNNVILIYTI